MAWTCSNHWVGRKNMRRVLEVLRKCGFDPSSTAIWKSNESIAKRPHSHVRWNRLHRNHTAWSFRRDPEPALWTDPEPSMSFSSMESGRFLRGQGIQLNPLKVIHKITGFHTFTKCFPSQAFVLSDPLSIHYFQAPLPFLVLLPLQLLLSQGLQMRLLCRTRLLVQQVFPSHKQSLQYQQFPRQHLLQGFGGRESESSWPMPVLVFHSHMLALPMFQASCGILFSQSPRAVFVPVLPGHALSLPTFTVHGVSILQIPSPVLVLVLHGHVLPLPGFDGFLAGTCKCIIASTGSLHESCAVWPCNFPCFCNCLLKPVPSFFQMDRAACISTYFAAVSELFQEFTKLAEHLDAANCWRIE